MNTTDLPEKPAPREAAAIQAEYDQLAAALGDIEFKHQVRRSPLMARMSDLNVEMGARLAIQPEVVAQDALETPEVDPHALDVGDPESTVQAPSESL